MEIAGNIPIGLEKFLRALAHKAEARVYRFVARDAAVLSAAYIVSSVPKARKLAVDVALYKVFAQNAAVVVGYPFKGAVPAGVEHKPVL